jgi:hypothetical protein
MDELYWVNRPQPMPTVADLVARADAGDSAVDDVRGAATTLIRIRAYAELDELKRASVDNADAFDRTYGGLMVGVLTGDQALADLAGRHLGRSLDGVQFGSVRAFSNFVKMSAGGLQVYGMQVVDRKIDRWVAQSDAPIEPIARLPLAAPNGWDTAKNFKEFHDGFLDVMGLVLDSTAGLAERVRSLNAVDPVTVAEADRLAQLTWQAFACVQAQIQHVGDIRDDPTYIASVYDSVAR